MHKLPSLSVFFPCYNEAANIPLFIQEALEVLPLVAKQFEIIIVNDGSKDGSGAVADVFAEQDKRIRVIHHETNRGYGAALRSGFEAARYDWVFFTDGDLQFKLAQIKKFVQYSDRFSVVIGYRRSRADGGIRAANARIFKLYIDILFRLHVTDIDCAFKLLKRSVLQQVKLESTGAFTSSELLYKLKKHGVIWKQLPVDHLPRQFGNPTGNHPRVVIKAGIEALQLYAHMKLQSLRHRI
jgi:glycosyltransferase involved in cell wall biosynthesis